MQKRGRPRYPGILTPREFEVLALVRERLTNEQIAGRLGLSADTAKFHVSEIITKLGVADRHEAAAWQPDRVAVPARWRLAGLAPPLWMHRLPFAWVPKAAAGAVLTGTAVGIGLLAWGVFSTSSATVTTTSPTDCRAEQTAGAAPNCAPVVAPAAAAVHAITAISGSGTHTCALKSGGVWCWGLGSGDGTTTGSSAPVAVSGLAGGVTAISANQFRTCALKDGGVWCWGLKGKFYGGGSGVLVAVSALASGVSAISATCAVKDGGAWCQDPSTDSDNPAFVAVPGLASGVSAISEGNALSVGPCALKDGGAWCWGSNWGGQLGNDSTTDSDLPVAVSGLASGVSAISVGTDHVCALKDGGVWCWGWNGEGQLGNGSTAQTHVPVGLLLKALRRGSAWCEQGR
jgi:DNA-binding CsgD family transcriptional regulator